MLLSGVQSYSYESKLSKTEKTDTENQVENTKLFELNNNQQNVNSNIKVEDYSIEMVMMMDNAGKITDNVDILCNLNAGALTTIVLSTASKAHSVINSVKSEISGYSAQISMIMNNPFLSDSEKKSRIKLIENKIKACAEEGNIKVVTLLNISEIITALAPTFMSLQSMGVDTNDMTAMFKELLTNVNTKPSDFSDSESKKDLYDTIDKNEKQFFGKNTTEMLNKFITKTDKEIKEIEEKMKKDDISEEERKKLKAELIIYKAENRLFKSLAN